MKNVRFYDWNCYVEVEEYLNGNTALQLCSRTEGPVAMATINLGIKLPKDQAFIKDYSENQGMLDALMDAGIVKEIIGFEQSGFVKIPLCRLNLD